MSKSARMDDIKNDPRFAHIVSDPRFRRMPKSKKKVKIDSRFQTLFTNKHFSHKTHIDKRGRPVLDTSKKNRHVMEQFYELSGSDQSDSDELDDDVVDTNAKSSSESDDTKESMSLKQKKSSSKATKVKKVSRDNGADKTSVNKKRKLKSVTDSNEESNEFNELPQAKRKKTISSATSVKSGKQKQTAPEDDNKSSSDDDSEEETDSEEDENLPEFSQDFEIEETEVDHKWNELHNDATEVSESTHRLAVCNMDWDFVKAQDLFVLFKSFVPEGGCVKSVSIYPSQFGLERMAEEMKLGPREMRNENATDRLKDETSGHKKRQMKSKDQQQLKRSEKEQAAEQTEKLREYQLNRLRYYYAVVDCDSANTADNIYRECDGREYQLSSLRLDLRFIPDDMTFDQEPKEIFSNGQDIIDYQPSKFSTTALCQAKVDVTWDETDFDRLSRRMAGLQQKELESIVEENKYADIIAPPESDSEEDEDGRPQWLKSVLDEDGEEKEYTEEERIQMYRKVLMDKIAAEEEETKKEEEDFDKEIEWQPGLKSSVEKKMKKKEKMKDENQIVGEYLERKKEKKKKKKDLKKMKISEEEKEDVAFSDDDLPHGMDMADLKELMDGETEGTKQGKKKKKNLKRSDQTDNGEISQQEKAELELILLDDNGSKTLAKPELVSQVDEGSKKSKKKRKNKLAKLKKSEQDREEFVLDLNDPRFSALYSSHHFHIDPTAPQFKKSKNMLKLVDEQVNRKVKKKKTTDISKPELKASGVEDSLSSRSVSQSLLDSLKKKMKK